MSQNSIKQIVKEKYSRIAQKAESNKLDASCCGPSSCCADMDYTVFSESYEELKGYNSDADLGLGCGIPTEFAGLKPGDRALDLGSGAGNDCFVARAIVGETGKVTGLDFSEEMIDKARRNTVKMGYTNVKFVYGDIDEMPFENNDFDVVISNCVLNLVPDKNKAFKEILRVLKPGGHFCVSDVVIKGELPEKLQTDAEMYAGCVAGAMQMNAYLETISQEGFHNVRVHKQRTIDIPRDILNSYLDHNELQKFITGEIGIFSITVSGSKL